MKATFHPAMLGAALLLHAAALAWLRYASPSPPRPPTPRIIEIQMAPRPLPVAPQPEPVRPALLPPKPAAIPPKPKPVTPALPKAVPAPAPLAKPAPVSPPVPPREPALSAAPPAPPASMAEPVTPVPAAPRPEAPTPPAAPRKVGPSLSASYASSNRKPPYPAMSRRNDEQGTVKLRVQVKADGSAGEVQIRESSGFPLLDESARSTVQTWRFNPATVDGKPVDEWYQLSIPFKLE